MAADMITLPAGDIAVPVHEGGFDWDGFYAGVYGVAQADSAAGAGLGAGVALGVNTSFDFVLVGAEVSVAGLGGESGATSFAQLLGKAGIFLSDDVMLYAAGGFGFDLGTPDERSFLIGAGLEMAVTDDISLKAQYLRSIPTQGDTTRDQVAIGANFHF
jgi:outer membrane immunogenic protein